MPKAVDPAPRRSDGLGAAGGALYDSVADRFELDRHEHQLLLEASRTTDQLAELDAAVRRDGVLIETPQGQRAHPALVEARGQRITLARLLAQLRLPQGEEGDTQASARPQRRSGARGTYGIKGVVL
jgi:hypothetical protein